ncbi:MAG: glucose-1-phosphate adenylyltransferase [Clostridia bacterium]|nr:glucose-1-phosphate adenylyltransferase [Clostridia bacterium]
MKKKIVAMLLAGGQGSRLGVLTSNMAKPAVPFGGKYRIIDFPLSNCVNSDIDTVGVLTQYKPLALNSYIGTGQHWDLDRMNGGVFVLPPYATGEDGRWYSGTADAIYQNREFVDQYDPKYVLILSGDHIYKMDYAKMLRHHEENQAKATIAVLPVPLEEAHRFGIMETDENLRITDFKEKPKEPKSNLASMGIYIFDWQVLKDFMERDRANPNSDNDFGKNIIPAMLEENIPMFAYPFTGYWKDVGTISSFWESHMDLIGDPPQLDLNDPAWRIFSRNPVMPPHYIGKDAQVSDSLVTEGCRVYGKVKHSVLFAGAVVHPDAEVYDSILLPNAVVEKGARVFRSIIGENAHVGQLAVIGGPLRPGETVDNKLTGDITLVGNDICVRGGAYLPVGSIANDNWKCEEETK